jgi:hypothetical protein
MLGRKVHEVASTDRDVSLRVHLGGDRENLGRREFVAHLGHAIHRTHGGVPVFSGE